jgi:FAD/FMN-containing dehydrogenase
VPVSAIPGFLEAAGAALSAAYPGLRIVCFGHLGDGNLHYNLSRPLGVRTMPSSPAPKRSTALFTIGWRAGRLDFGRARHRPAQARASARLQVGRRNRPDAPHQAAFDPRGLMNPGKVL